MKQFVAIILMVLLAANASGFHLTQHNCGKKFQYLIIGDKKGNTSCCCKGEAKDRGCCNTKIIKVTIDDAKCFANHSMLISAPIVAILPQPTYFPAEPLLFVSKAQFVPRIHPPPLILPVRKHVFLGVFLI